MLNIGYSCVLSNNSIPGFVLWNFYNLFYFKLTINQVRKARLSISQMSVITEVQNECDLSKPHRLVKRLNVILNSKRWACSYDAYFF